MGIPDKFKELINDTVNRTESQLPDDLCLSHMNIIRREMQGLVNIIGNKVAIDFTNWYREQDISRDIESADFGEFLKEYNP